MEKDGRVLPPEELPIQVAAKTGQPIRDYMADMVLDDGTRYSLLGNINPLFDAEGKPNGAVGVFLDLTAMRKLELQQLEAKAYLELQRRLMNQREQDRVAIARDLHDGPIQTLSSSNIKLHIIKNMVNDPAVGAEMDQLGEDIRSTIQELREIMNELRPAVLMHFGLMRAIRSQLDDLHSRYPQLEVSLDMVGDDKPLSSDLRLTLFRIFQSAIANVVRHAQATRVTLQLSIEPDFFQMEISDNGKGFSIPQNFSRLAREGHYGLVGMKERTEAIGAQLIVLSEAGSGTTVVIKGPIISKQE